MTRKKLVFITIFILFPSIISAQKCITFYNDGVLLKCRMIINNKVQKEIWKLVSTKIIVKEFQLDNGLKNGITKHYYSNGKIKESGFYLKNKREGEWKSYYENGTLRSLVNWKNSYQEGKAIFYYNNRKIWSKGVFKIGIQVGEWKFYDLNNGKLTKMGTYEDKTIDRTNEIVEWKFYDDQEKLLRIQRFDKETLEWHYYDNKGHRINWSDE